VIAQQFGVTLPASFGALVAKSGTVQKALGAIIPAALMGAAAGAAVVAVAQLIAAAYDEYQNFSLSGSPRAAI